MTDIGWQLEDALGKLAAQGSSQQIAAYFEREDIVGYRLTVSRCPVANYLRQTLGDVQDDLKVFPRTNIVNEACGEAHLRGRQGGVTVSTSAYLPQEVAKFALEFDRGMYSTLVIQAIEADE